MKDYKAEIREALSFLKDYFRNPVSQIQNLPDWSWPLVLAIHICFAITSGALAGIVNGSIWIFVFGIGLVPIVSLITVAICAAFLYYTILLFLNQQVHFRRLFILTVLANSFFLIFQILSNPIPPMGLLGFAFSCALIAVGLVENFMLPKKAVVKMVGLLFLGFVVIWTLGLFQKTPISSGL